VNTKAITTRLLATAEPGFFTLQVRIEELKTDLFCPVAQKQALVEWQMTAGLGENTPDGAVARLYAVLVVVEILHHTQRICILGANDEI